MSRREIVVTIFVGLFVAGALTFIGYELGYRAGFRKADFDAKWEQRNQ